MRLAPTTTRVHLNSPSGFSSAHHTSKYHGPFYSKERDLSIANLNSSPRGVEFPLLATRRKNSFAQVIRVDG